MRPSALNGVHILDCFHIPHLALVGTLKSVQYYCQESARRCRGQFFATDVGDVADDKCFTVQLPCPEAHPGLCVRADEERYDLICQLAHAIEAHFLAREKGSFFNVRAWRGDVLVLEVHLHFSLILKRRGYRRISHMFTLHTKAEDAEQDPCTLIPSLTIRMTPDIVHPSRAILHRHNSWQLGKLLATTQPALEPLVVDAIKLPAHSEDVVGIAQYPRSTHLPDAAKLFPRAARSKMGVRKTLEGLDGLIEENGPAPTRCRGKSASFKFKIPERLKAKGGKLFLETSIDTDSESSTLRTPRESDESQDESSKAGASATLEAEASPSAAPERPRESHVKPWGIWSISRLLNKETGEQVGWGANCNKHHVKGACACKKPFRCVIGSSLPETLCIAKQWLLMGEAFAYHSALSRFQHCGIKREEIPLEPESELDRKAAHILAVNSASV